MNKIILLACAVLVVGCTINKDIVGDWTIVYVGEGENVKEGAVGVPFSGMYKAKLVFRSDGEVDLMDLNNKLLRTCKYTKDEKTLLFKQCMAKEVGGETPDYSYEYEFDSSNEMTLYSADMKHVLKLQRVDNS